MDMIIVQRFSDSIAANMARMRLGEYGIQASVLEATRLYGTCTDDVRLMVWEDDASDASKILTSVEEPVVFAEDPRLGISNVALEHEVAGPSEIGRFFNAEIAGVKVFMLILWLGLALMLAALLIPSR